MDESDHVVIGHIPLGEFVERINKGRSIAEVSKVVTDFISKQRGNRYWLTLEDFVAVARRNKNGFFKKVVVDPFILEDEESPVVKSCLEVHRYIGEKLAEDGWNRETGDMTFEKDDELSDGMRRIYGVNTGFGSLRKFDLNSADTGRLSANILFSHATGVGKPLAAEIVRGMMLLRLRTFCQGSSGVRPIIIKKLAEMLNAGIIPYIPEKGSVGSSGDLAPLSHLFLVMVGFGKAWVIPNGVQSGDSVGDVSDDREYRLRDEESSAERIERWIAGDKHVLLTGAEALSREVSGVEPLKPEELQAKDGLALTNGAAVSAAVLALGAFDAMNLYRTANMSGAITLQAVSGHTRAMETVLQAIRPHPGQVVTGWEMLRFLEGSALVNRCAHDNVAQDDYSIRAIPQVHGAVWNAIDHVSRIAETEINSGTDNPVFFEHLLKKSDGFHYKSDSELVKTVYKRTLDTTHCSGANFHGEPMALAIDYLKIAVAELASISERRVQLILDSDHNRGLPGNLTIGARGLHTGFMITQYTAASLVSENKVLCHPSSVDSIPTSANAEDHVSMATNAARHLRIVLQNVSDVLAIELICGLQAVDIRTTYLHRWIKGEMDRSDCRDLKEYIEKTGVSKARVMFDFTDVNHLAGKTAQDLDNTSLRLSPITASVLKNVRNSESNYYVPFIFHDGFEEAKLQDSSHDAIDRSEKVASFREFEPAELISRISQAILRGEIAELIQE